MIPDADVQQALKLLNAARVLLGAADEAEAADEATENEPESETPLRFRQKKKSGSAPVSGNGVAKGKAAAAAFIREIDKALAVAPWNRYLKAIRKTVEQAQVVTPKQRSTVQAIFHENSPETPEGVGG
jgi:precorrin-6B methylase 1